MTLSQRAAEEKVKTNSDEEIANILDNPLTHIFES